MTDNTDRTGDHCAKRNKKGTERQVFHDLGRMCIKKLISQMRERWLADEKRDWQSQPLGAETPRSKES